MPGQQVRSDGADLLALRPNMDIRLHIVAPEAPKANAFDEIRRPVFSLAELKHLEHLSDSVLEEYEESALV